MASATCKSELRSLCRVPEAQNRYGNGLARPGLGPRFPMSHHVWRPMAGRSVTKSTGHGCRAACSVSWQDEPPIHNAAYLQFLSPGVCRHLDRLRTGSRPIMAEAPADLIDRLIAQGHPAEGDLGDPRKVGDALIRVLRAWGNV